MRNLVKTASLCWLAALAFTVCGCGEESKRNANKDGTGGGYLTKPFDPSVEKLPPNFIGCDASAIYQAVASTFSQNVWKRSEYEKSVDYVKRINNMVAQLGEKTLMGDIKFSSTLAFTLPPVGAARGSKKDKSVETLYDADREVLTISAGDSFWFSEKEKYSFGVHLQRGEGGTLAPGGDFWLIPPDDWGIIFTESDNLPTEDIVWRLREVAPEKAQRERNKIGALCVCNLRYEDTAQATQNSRKDWAVWVTEPEFWLYHIETGDVLAKYSWGETERGVEKKIGDLTMGKSESKKVEEEPFFSHFERVEEEKETVEPKVETSKSDAASSDGSNGSRVGETADELRKRIVAGRGEDDKEAAREKEAKKEKREAREAVENYAKEHRRSAEFWQDGNKRLDNRLAAVKRLTSSREIDAPLTFAVPGDFATLQEALAEAESAPYNGPIPRIVLDAGEYDASGLTLKTFVDVQSATGKPEDVVLTVDAAKPMTVDGETVVSFDGVTLRQVGGGAKSGACVEVKRGIALLFGCVLDGKNGAKSATGVKAVGLKSAVVCQKCIATGFSLSAQHVEDGAFGWTVESVFGPKNRFGASSKGARLEVEKCEFRGNETGVYFGKLATGGASGNVYAENKRYAQILDGAKVEVDAPNVEKK